MEGKLQLCILKDVNFDNIFALISPKQSELIITYDWVLGFRTIFLNMFLLKINIIIIFYFVLHLLILYIKL